MFEFSILVIIFITSILLVYLFIGKMPTVNKFAASAYNNANNLTIKSIFKSASFLAWSEDKGGVIWANSAVKSSNNKIKTLGRSAFSEPNGFRSNSWIGHITQNDTSSNAFNVYNHTIDCVEYYFAFPKIKNKSLPKSTDQFIQTMSATFAHLQIGIAVFNRRNELSLFNPALCQHLGLRPEWLLKKPNLLGFLDRLRNTHVLPEPKDYISWRKTFLKIERSAMKDDYREDWGLPDGRSLRVIGRPHPSGTVVFLFEDVTAVLAMERQYRSQIHCLKSTMDATTIGMVAFDRKGDVVFLNEILKQALDKHKILNNIQDFSRIMQDIFLPTPVWGDLRQYIEEAAERSGWQADVETRTGEYVSINFEPVASGNTLCEFHFPIKINSPKNVGLTCAAQ